MRTLTPGTGLLLCSLGCSDYNFAKGAGTVGGGVDTGAAPDIRVDPGSIALEGVCGVDETELVVANVGSAPLDVTGATTDGAGWTVDTAALPVTLDPGGSFELPLSAGVGTATIHVESTDPHQPVVSIPVSASGDAAPSITLTSPTEGAIFPAGGGTFAATVSDPEDAPTDLEVVWTSDVDGVLGQSYADASGAVSTRTALATPGTHTVTAQVVDRCGNTAEAAVGVCQDAGYTSDELDIASWHFEGSASWDSTNNWLELTPVTPNVVGSAFATDATVGGDNVEIRFHFYIGDGTGADGISLTALDSDRMTGFLGGSGCGLGYGGDAPCTAGPALPGWSIEVDTYYNGDADPTSADHVMFTFDGDVDNAVLWAELPEMEDTGWHEMVVTVADPRVRVEIDGVVYLDDSVSGHFAFPAYVGFTAGTGGETNQHLIESLEVTESVCGG